VAWEKKAGGRVPASCWAAPPSPLRDVFGLQNSPGNDSCWVRGEDPRQGEMEGRCHMHWAAEVRWRRLGELPGEVVRMAPSQLLNPLLLPRPQRGGGCPGP